MFNLNHSARSGNAKLAQQAAGKINPMCCPILFLVLMLRLTLRNKHFAQKAE